MKSKKEFIDAVYEKAEAAGFQEREQKLKKRKFYRMAGTVAACLVVCVGAITAMDGMRMGSLGPGDSNELAYSEPVMDSGEVSEETEKAKTDSANDFDGFEAGDDACDANIVQSGGAYRVDSDENAQSTVIEFGDPMNQLSREENPIWAVQVEVVTGYEGVTWLYNEDTDSEEEMNRIIDWTENLISDMKYTKEQFNEKYGAPQPGTPEFEKLPSPYYIVTLLGQLENYDWYVVDEKPPVDLE